MNSRHWDEINAIRPLHVVMIVLVIITVAGSSLLLSAAESQTLVDGAIEWHAESPLRAVVQLLCLNYQVPTIHAGAVKNYLLGIGAGLAILCLTIAIASRTRSTDDRCDINAEDSTPTEETELEAARTAEKVHIAPLIAAQVLVGLYLLWSFASSRWSSASELAVGGSILLTIRFLWVFMPYIAFALEGLVHFSLESDESAEASESENDDCCHYQRPYYPFEKQN